MMKRYKAMWQKKGSVSKQTENDEEKERVLENLRLKVRIKSCRNQLGKWRRKAVTSVCVYLGKNEQDWSMQKVRMCMTRSGGSWLIPGLEWKKILSYCCEYKCYKFLTYSLVKNLNVQCCLFHQYYFYCIFKQIWFLLK